MDSDLAHFIRTLRIANTHEHLSTEDAWRTTKPDVIGEIFDHYIKADFVVAGIPLAEGKSLFDTSQPDVAGRFAPAMKYWQQVRFTGYGEAARIVAKEFFDIDEITPETLAAAQERLPPRWPDGDRLAVLRDRGLMDHVQIDALQWACQPDPAGPEFFFQDLSMANFCAGKLRQRHDSKYSLDPHCQTLHAQTGVQVRNLATLRAAMESLFTRYGRLAVAVKSQHAYDRTLAWSPRSDADAEAALRSILRDHEGASVEQRNCLGDWCIARVAELAGEHHLPFKIHTGSYAGEGVLPVDWVRPGHLCGLLREYPKTRFVLMHMAWPFDDELLAIAKHYANVWVDLCWAWSINPRGAGQFVSEFLHAAPINKLLGFGGDTRRPRVSVAYAQQARRWLTRTLQQEIEAGDLSEADAIGIARRVLRDNAFECFDIRGLRQRLTGR